MDPWKIDLYIILRRNVLQYFQYFDSCVKLYVAVINGIVYN